MSTKFWKQVLTYWKKITSKIKTFTQLECEQVYVCNEK